MNEHKPSTAPIAKAVGPVGSQIVPETLNGNMVGPAGGGFFDQAGDRSMAMAPTAVHGQGPAAYQTDSPPDQGDQTWGPGRATRPSPNPMGPSKLLTAPMSTGTPTMAAESGASSVARLALNGGRVPMDPAAHRPPALPTQGSTFPDLTPGGSPMPTPGPSGGGTMYGVMQGGRGLPSSGSTNLTPM